MNGTQSAGRPSSQIVCKNSPKACASRVVGEKPTDLLVQNPTNYTAICAASLCDPKRYLSTRP
jgi:hypothetical protein